MKKPLLFLGAALCLLAGPAPAADMKDFPAQTRWILSVDFKAAQASPLLTDIAVQLDSPQKAEAEAKLAAFKALSGVDLLKDVGQLVIAGNGNAEKGGVAYVYGTFDVPRLTTLIAGYKDFAAADHGGVKLLSWLDEKDSKVKFLAFAKPGLALLSNSPGTLTDALDVLAGRQAGLAPDSPLRDTFTRMPKALLSLQAFDLASIVGQAPRADMLRKAQALSLSVQAADADTLEAALSVTAADAETALPLQQAAQGIQALMLLQAGANPELATLASLAQITCTGSTVGVTLKLPRAVIAKAVRACQARRAAAAAAAAAAAN